ncbi:2Fe-2S iron-sulfur cluster-binding protein [Sulfurospirillum arcachonense]|uniref:2Fe-2S iron-sulfur cluster-binding protein n=1 Tax=Sulfurospirillum arcachonense TaxID=57666 RepID=UPI000469910B|nr:2Fe-2S iron-sulfur cluster-binding protein [Sulfurospirillum arcachonense]
MATIIVDNKEITVENGALLIEELLKNGIEIPHFCYHPALGKDGNCRMCMVEIEGKKRPQIACDTPITEGMIIRTKGEKIQKVKRQILEMELINHPIDCPICDQAGECSLQNYYMDVGLYENRLSTPKTHGKKNIDIGANVVLDQERCVLCTRCVRFTKDITKTKELGVLNRTDHSVISIFPGRPLSNPYAMNVVDLCPVGALTSKDFRFHKRVWFLEPAEAICNGCSKGCSIYVDHHKAKYEDDSIFRYRPRFNDQINGYFICDVGRLSYKVENKNRESVAKIRGKESEYEYASGKLLRLLKRHQGKILFLISPSLSLEEMAQVKKLSIKYGAKLSGYDICEYDKTFGDDYLKCNDLSTNRRGLNLLDIDESELGESVENIDLAVLIGRDDIETIKNYEQIEVKVLVHPSMPKDNDIYNLYLPMLTHTSRQGSFINIDGYLQFSKSNVEYAKETQSLLQIISILLNDNATTCKEIWDESLNKIIKNIHFEDIQKRSVKMDES